MKNNKGLSTVVSTLLLILLGFVATGIVWTMISGIITEKTEQSSSCFGTFGKIEVNNKFTCNNKTSGISQFSIEREDIELDSIVVKIISGGQGKAYTLPTITPTTIYGMYNHSNNGQRLEIIAPSKNSGSTYFLNLTQVSLENLTSIEVAPIVNGFQCESSDVLPEVVDCNLLF